MDTLTIQYIIVFAILLGTVIWILVRLKRRRKSGGGGSCCGCTMSQVCASRGKDPEKAKGKSHSDVQSCCRKVTSK